ncbi:hypothetical protein HIM_02650 [Hirsutella minnesotensis 3608]|nr:hypothetical protein HIM_02650 [Hirsutella minnesotensis 3608]
MRCKASAAAAAAAAASFTGLVNALDPAPVALQASDWLGVDGNWSTVSFLLGSNSDVVNVLISTTLSEFWAIGPGGCVGKEPHCNRNRGGIYSPQKSKHWTPMGLWQLGLQTFGYNDNGEYGLDTVNAYSPITNIAFGMSNVLMSAINTTSPFLGFFGLGIQQGRFGDMVADSAITQAVKTFGWIPSYSYGFTAGAHYRHTPVSATLGGFDKARFVPHDTAFTLTQGESTPRTLVRGIQLSASNSQDQPELWSTSTEILSDWNTSFTAMIDSSTPYLWLPEPVCNRFAEALNLTYNNTFDLYTLSNDLYRRYRANNSLTFTFSLTSFDNNDNFGLPLEVPGLVNITLPLQSFVSLLEYPFARGAIKYGDPAVPYFTLRKSYNDSFVIGRSFLQEAYLITKFDEALYSIHQARFPANPEGDAHLVPIRQPANSPYPPPPSPNKGEELTTPQMIGIAVGAVLLCSVVLAGFLYYRRQHKKSRKSKKSTDDGDEHDTASTITPDSPKTPVSRILSKICRKQSQAKSVREIDGRERTNTSGVFQMPSEAPDCQIYELPAAISPVELDAGSDRNSLEDHDLGTVNTQTMSAYELAQRKIDRQLRGPVPAYSPPTDGLVLQPEKAMPNPRLLNTSHSLHQPSPTSSTRSGGGESSLNIFPTPELSPISPREEWGTNTTILPSPITGSMPWRSLPGTAALHADHADVRTSRSQPEYSTAPATSDSSFATRTSLQRPAVEYSKVVCLGPLPENIELHRQTLMASRLAASDTRGVSMFSAPSRHSQGSLGSNYTDEEDRIVEEMTRASFSPGSVNPYAASSSSTRDNDSPPASSHRPSPKKLRTIDADSADGEMRIDPGRDLIHVPQLADKRYSWEEQ